MKYSFFFFFWLWNRHKNKTGAGTNPPPPPPPLLSPCSGKTRGCSAHPWPPHAFCFIPCVCFPPPLPTPYYTSRVRLRAALHSHNLAPTPCPDYCWTALLQQECINFDAHIFVCLFAPLLHAAWYIVRHPTAANIGSTCRAMFLLSRLPG